MHWEGDVSVLHALKRGSKRIGLLGLAGVIAGVDGCARACVLEDLGLTGHLAAITAVSTFAGPALYLAAGKLNEGASCYWEECTTNRFFRLSPARVMNGKILNVEYLVQDVFQKEISPHEVYSFQGTLLFAVTDAVTGNEVLIDVKSTPDMFEAALAAIAAPILYRPAVHIGGKRYMDGVIACPFPWRAVAETCELDGVIVFANRPRISDREEKIPVGERIMSTTLPRGVRRKFLGRRRAFAQELEALRAGGFPHVIFWADDTLQMFERRPEVIKLHANMASQHMREVLEIAG